MKPSMILQAPRRYSITIVGDTDAIRSRAIIMPTHLPYLLGRLFSGDRVAQRELEMFGLRISVEWDPDDWPTIGQPGSAASGAKC